MRKDNANNVTTLLRDIKSNKTIYIYLLNDSCETRVISEIVI